MKASIDKSEIKGKVQAPPSKSYTIRGLMCAALADGVSEILHPLASDDTKAAIDTLGKVGIRIHQSGDSWHVTGAGFHKPDTDLFCSESAATLRFMTAICALIPGRCRLVAGPSLSKRPVKPLIEALRQLGVNCSCHGELPPVVVEGGRPKGGVTELPGNISSQFVSALLFISPLAEKEVSIRLTTALESIPYVAMTLDCLSRFGITIGFSETYDEFEAVPQKYEPAEYQVEGDWSSASYILALGAVSGDTEVEGLNPESLQGDRVIVDLLKDMGASVKVNNNLVAVKKSKLRAIRADLSNCIDLLPTVAVLAAVAEGASEFTGIKRARLKESDRVIALKEGLLKMGVKVTERRNKLSIIGSEPEGSVIDPRNDHRIAMAFSILGSVVGGTVINNAECVSKTYPEFWDILKSIGGVVAINGK